MNKETIRIETINFLNSKPLQSASSTHNINFFRSKGLVFINNYIQKFVLCNYSVRKMLVENLSKILHGQTFVYKLYAVWRKLERSYACKPSYFTISVNLHFIRWSLSCFTDFYQSINLFLRTSAFINHFILKW